MTKIIGVIQLKGGAGKSTVATNLAGMLNEKGSTLLIDSDEPQYSAEGWYLLREEAQRLSIGRSTLYDWIQKGYFPKPIKLSPHCSVWRESTVNQWLAEKAT